jgi:hypothetical protein
MAAADPILDLSTLIAERPPIRIDGVTYHLKAPDELTLAESHQFTRWGKALEELGMEEGRVADLEALLRVVAKATLADVPDEVFARMSPAQHQSIVEVFTMLLLARRSRLTGAVVGIAAARSTGRKPFPGSSAPMAATPDGGSTARPPLS